jgi:hypothetical protein
MNVKEELLKERTQTKTRARAIAEYACSSEANFNELIKCFLDDEYRLAQRAAWIMSWAARTTPQLLIIHIKEVVAQLSRRDVHHAIIRNSLRILATVDLPEEVHADVMNACFAFLERPSTPVAVKVFSLNTLFNLSRSYPEIRNELRLIIENNLANASAAFKSRGNKILKALR